MPLKVSLYMITEFGKAKKNGRAIKTGEDVLTLPRSGFVHSQYITDLMAEKGTTVYGIRLIFSESDYRLQSEQIF